MGRKKTGNIYVTIKVPESMIGMMDELCQKKGFTSRTDVTKYAVRTLYETLMPLSTDYIPKVESNEDDEEENIEGI